VPVYERKFKFKVRKSYVTSNIYLTTKMSMKRKKDQKEKERDYRTDRIRIVRKELNGEKKK